MPPRITTWWSSSGPAAARSCLAAAANTPQAAAASAIVAPAASITPLASLFGALSLSSSTAPLPQRPQLQTQQTRRASILANLRDNPGAYNKRIRKGRGPSSGYGKTSGRGQKGTKARGKVKPWFQGGQTSLLKTWGHKGFVNSRAPEMSEVNLDQVQAWINAGRLDATKQITPRELITSGLIGRPRDGVKLLARGANKLTSPLDIVVSRASLSAIEAIEATGGKVVTRYYTKQAIQRLLKGESVHTSSPLPVGGEHVESVLAERRSHGRHTYRLPDPTSRWDIEYYRDPAHRGYLSHTIQPGESPSLYWAVPTERKKRSVAKKEAKKLDADRIF